MQRPAAERRAFVAPAVVMADALGYPVRGLRGGHIQQLVGRITAPLADTRPIADRPERYRHPGTHSALGQQFLSVLAAFEDDGTGRDPLAIAGSRLLELAGPEPDRHRTFGAIREPGRPLAAALKRWREEFPWEAEQFLAGKAGSKGASCAVAALALIARGIPTDDPLHARVARLTHARPLALASAYAVARLAELLLEGDRDPRKVDVQALLARLIADVRAHEVALHRAHRDLWREYEWTVEPAGMADALEPLASLLREDNDALATSSLLRGLERFEPESAVTQITHGFAPVAVPWAIYHALGPRTPAAALEEIVNGGVETCTIGAVAAGLLAARWGPDFFPPEWLSATRGVDVANRLARGTAAGAAEDWLALERELTAEEQAVRDALAKELQKQQARDRERGREVEPPRKSPKPKLALPPQESAPFAPPPSAWLHVDDEVDPAKKKQLKEARARRRIDWKEERHQRSREHPTDDGDD